MSAFSPLQNFYLEQEEPLGSCFVGLREIILSFDEQMSEHWKWKLPFFCFKGKNLCYLWKEKKTDIPYIGFVEGQQIEHHSLEQGDRKRMKILKVDPNDDLPLVFIQEVLKEAIELVP